jgi:hypothetical protein
VSLTQAPWSAAAATVTGLAAFAAVAVDAGWQFVRHGTVMAHEGAHAVLGSLAFRKVSGVTLNADATRRDGHAGRRPPGRHLHRVRRVRGTEPVRPVRGASHPSGHSVAVLWVALFLLGVLATGLSWSYGLITVVVAGILV